MADRRRGAALLAAAIAMLLLVVAPAAARETTTWAVDCDDGDDLQTTIDDAVTNDTITIAGTCVGNFTIDGKRLTLIGPATLDADGAGTTLELTDAFVRMSMLEIRGGSDHGVLVHANSTAELRNGCVVTANTGGNGGGISSDRGTVLLNQSTVRNNHATGAGGGIYSNRGLILVQQGTIHANKADGAGGGIANVGGTLRLQGTVSSNRAFGFGGGILNSGTPPASAIANSSASTTISGNIALGAGSAGGGIYNVVSPGGIARFSLGGTLVRLNNARRGGGIFALRTGSRVTLLAGTSVRNNTATAPNYGGTQCALGGAFVGVVLGTNVLANVPPQFLVC